MEAAILYTAEIGESRLCERRKEKGTIGQMVYRHLIAMVRYQYRDVNVVDDSDEQGSTTYTSLYSELAGTLHKFIQGLLKIASTSWTNNICSQFSINDISTWRLLKLNSRKGRSWESILKLSQTLRLPTFQTTTQAKIMPGR